MSTIGNKETLSKNLSYYMKVSGRIQKELSEIAGVAPSTFNDWIKAKKYPRIDKIEVLAGYFGILKSDLIEVISAVIYALEKEQLPELETKLKNNDGTAVTIQKRQLEKMKSELNEMEEQEEKQYDLLEKKVYSEELFLKRNKALKAKMEELKTRIFETSKDLPKEIDYAEKIVTLKNAIEALRNENLSAEAKNKLLKTIIERIEYEFTESEGHGKTRYALHIRLLV